MKLKISSTALALSLFACGPAAPEPSTPQSAPSTTEGTEADAGENEGAGSDASAPETEDSSRAPREKEATSDSPMPDIMAVHARDAEKVRAAVIAGHPEDAGPPAESFLTLFDLEKLPKSWVEPATRMQASAQRVKDSSDIAGVAAGIADVGTSCGWCHARLGGPKASSMPPPDNEGTLESQMKLHTWATERLWEGLYVPSGAAWSKGAKALAETEFPAEVIAKGGVYAKSAAKEFKKVAAKLSKQSSPTARAALYSELLTTCGSCHVAVED